MRRSLALIVALLTLGSPAHAARIWSTGFELNSYAMEMDVAATGTTSIVTSPVRTGTYAFRTNPTASNGFLTKDTATLGGGHIYVRFYFRIATAPSATTWMFIFTTPTTAGWGLKVTNARELQLTKRTASADTQVGSTSAALDVDTWYQVEFFGDWSTNDCSARLNGVEFATGAAACDVQGTEFRMGVGLGIGTTTADFYFDDFGFNDNAGSTTQNTWLGEGNIIHLYAAGAGDADTTVTPAGCVNPEDCVDESPTPDDDTTEVALTGTSSQITTAVTNTPASPDSDDTIRVVQIGMRIQVCAAGTGNVIPGVKSQASGTVVDGTTVSIANTAYASHDDTLPRNYQLTSVVDPQAGGVWTKTLLDSMQIRIRTTDGNPDTCVSSAWALVDYRVVTAGAGPPLGSLMLMGAGR